MPAFRVIAPGCSPGALLVDAARHFRDIIEPAVAPVVIEPAAVPRIGLCGTGIARAVAKLAADERIDPAVVVIIAPRSCARGNLFAQSRGDRHIVKAAARVVLQQREPRRRILETPYPPSLEPVRCPGYARMSGWGLTNTRSQPSEIVGLDRGFRGGRLRIVGRKSEFVGPLEAAGRVARRGCDRGACGGHHSWFSRLRTAWPPAGRPAPPCAAINSGHHPEARKPLAQWLRAEPGSAEAHALLAQVALEEGDLGKVTDELNQARALGYPKATASSDFTRSRWRGSAGSPRPSRSSCGLIEPEIKPDPAVDEALARLYLMTYGCARPSRSSASGFATPRRDARPFLWLTEYDRRMEVDNSEALEDPLPRGARPRPKSRRGPAGAGRDAQEGAPQRRGSPGI